MEIGQWLKLLELEQYADIFIENDIGIDDLTDLTAEELKDELGIVSLGHRKKLLKAIEQLGSVAEDDRVILDNYPYILAYPYKLMLEENGGFAKLQYMKDVFLNILKYMGLFVATEYFLSPIKSPEINNLFREKLFQPHFGHWNHFIREALAQLGAASHKFLIPELPEYYDRVQLSGKAAKFSLETKFTDESGELRTVNKKLTAIDGLINFRNRYIGHGLTLPEDESRAVYATYLPLLKYLLENMAFCTEYPLYRYRDGEVEKLMGVSVENCGNGAKPDEDKSIWMRTPSEEELPLLPFFVPPEQYMAESGRDSRLFVYEQHTSRRIIYFSPEQRSGETAGEPVRILSAMLEEKNRMEPPDPSVMDSEFLGLIFDRYNSGVISELEAEKKIIQGAYCSRSEAEAGIKSFLSSDSRLYFIASEAGSGKTNLLAHMCGSLRQAGEVVLFLRGMRLSALDAAAAVAAAAGMKSGEELQKTPAFRDGRIVILIDGLNEHKNPAVFLASIIDFLNGPCGGAVKAVVSWRISALSELPEVRDDTEQLIYKAGSESREASLPVLQQYCYVLSPMNREEMAFLWKTYAAHPSKEFRPMFSLEDLEARDRNFARGLSNPLLMRLFLGLYNRQQLPPASKGFSLWAAWYKDIKKRIPEAEGFMSALAGMMYRQKSLELEFDSLFDIPETSEIIRRLDIDSPYRRLLAAGVLSRFFRDGVLYISFTVEASFHYLLSVRLRKETAIIGAPDSDAGGLVAILSKNRDYPAVAAAVSIILEQDTASGGGLLDSFTASAGFESDIAAAAVYRSFEKYGTDHFIKKTIISSPANSIKALIAADYLMERNLRTAMRYDSFSAAAASPELEDVDDDLKKLFLYRYCIACHENGKYDESLEAALRYFTMCGCGEEGAAEIECGYACNRLAVSYRKLMRSRPESETEKLGEKALEYGNRALEIFSALLNPGHPEFARIYDTMMKVHEYRREWVEAVSYGKKRIAFIETNSGSMNPDLASAYNNTAIVLREAGERDESVEFSNRAMDIIRLSLDPNHIEMAYANWTLAYTYGKFGEPSEAVECMERCISILERILPPQHPSFAAAAKGLEEFRRAADARIADD